MNQVHKEQLNSVENALANRQGLEVEIFGMEGIPDDIKQQHDQRVTQRYWEEQAERRAATGNPAPGGGGDFSKKPKFDKFDDLKSRLAAHKAKLAGGDTGDTTPMEGVQTSHSPAPPMAGSPVQGLPGAQTSPPPGLAHPYNAPQFQPPPFQQAAPFGQPGFGAPGTPQFPGQPSFQPPFQGSPPFNQGPYQPPPVPGANGHQRQGSIPGSSNLPQRPAFNAPQVNAAQFQQMHHGQAPGMPGANGHDGSATATSVDDLISSAAKNAVATTSAIPTGEPAADKKVKKEKDKNMRLIYADNETSPEEKMAQLPRYAFTPDRRPGTTLGSAIGSAGAAVTGTTRGDDI